MKISKLVVLVMALVFISCNSKAGELVAQTGFSRDRTESIKYVQDARTGICFAVYETNYPQLTCVPCEKIPQQILNKGR